VVGKTWVLDTGTKGTGANVVPLDHVLDKQDPSAETRSRRPATPRPSAEAPAKPVRRRRAADQVERTVTALPPGHVRKRSTGEIGKVQSVDARAGTVTVRWLKGGGVSTVPLSAVLRR